MKLQQLRYVCEVARQGLNLSEAALSLHTSQPGISSQIRLLESELGIEIFVRNGKRVVDVTEPGRMIITIAERMLHDAKNLKQVGKEFANVNVGSLTVATTHTQARYALPPIIQRFAARYPKVQLSLRQGSPNEICEMVSSGKADFAIATEALDDFEDLIMLPCFQWNRCVIAPLGHPLLEEKMLTLESIAKYPIVTYDFSFTRLSQVNTAFKQRGLEPKVVMTAIDADVIKTYVALGLGIGIVAAMAFDLEKDTDLRALDASHLFESSTTRIGIQRNAYLRGYAFDFIELFAPHLTRKAVERAMTGDSSNYDL